jgi:hypothetical protein
MARIKFEIRHRSGEHESALIDAERVLVGSAAYCDLRLPMEDAAPEQVLVSVSAGRLCIEAKSADPLVLVDGAPLSPGNAAEGSVVAIGRVRLAVSLDGSLESARSAAAGRGVRDLVTATGLLLLLGSAAWLVLAPADGAIAPPPDTTLELFSTLQPSCPQQGGPEALAFAEEQLALASAKQERLPFVVHEGIAAFDLYETAAACFRMGGGEGRAALAEEAAELLQSSLTDEFRARRLRLSHLLEVKDYELASVDLAVLGALTQGKKGEYVQWLEGVAAELSAPEAR